MGWAIILLLVSLTAIALIALGRLPRSLWELTGAALLFGVAGYAWQGQPDLKGDPRDASQVAPRFDEDLVKLRRSFGEYGEAGQWLTLSDGRARQGKSKEAANVLMSGLRANPENPTLWLGMGNALVAHAQGILSPAAEYSYQQAMRLSPEGAAAPYFYGLALAQSGQYAPAAKIWQKLSDRLPAEVPLQVQLKSNLAQVDRLLERQSGMPAR